MKQQFLQELGNPILLKSSVTRDSVELARKIGKLSERTKRDLGLPYLPFESVLHSEGVLLYAKGITGQIKIGNIELSIIPKYVPYDSATTWSKTLLKMLEISKTKSFFHISQVSGKQDRLVFLDILASGFIAALESALSRGLPQGYTEKSEYTPFLRGRIDAKRLYPSILSRPDLLYCHTGELTVDIPLNRLLKWACSYLSIRVSSASLKKELEQIFTQFENVPPILPREIISSSTRLPGTLIHFEEAFRIAKWLASGRGLTFSEGTQELPGVLLRSDVVFQDFVTGCISMICKKHPNWSHESQHVFPLAERIASKESFRTIPDEILFVDDTLRLVIDAKYKGNSVLEDLSPQISDVYQILAASRAANCEKSMLIYPNTIQRPPEEAKIIGTGNPQSVFLLGIDPLLLSNPNGSELLFSHFENSIVLALSS